MSGELNSELLELRKKMRHSAAHVLADIVTRKHPDIKLGIGPPTDDGFYYDFLTENTFSEADLEQFEKEMQAVIDEDLQFVYQEYEREEAKSINADQPLKLELIDDIPDGEVISTYTHGRFEDLCGGPHVESTGQIKAYKLLNVAGAYWRGDENRPMLQRIYGTAFENSRELKQHIKNIEEARKRDHRVLGKKLNLFSISEDIGPGLVIWHPKGAIVRGITEEFWKSEHVSAGYSLVYTPHIGKSDLWKTSGHLEFYADNMFAAMDMDGQDYYLKPMNCPFHMTYYKTDLRSYRDLPIRIGELGTVYRYERGGVLSGLLRVRGLTQDDAHIFCREDQVQEEVNQVLDLTFHLLKTFGFNDYRIMLATKPEKAVGEDAKWDIATQALKDTLNSRQIDYEVDEGGGAFYGPKIDIHIRDAIGRLWQVTTVQFDFNLPNRFELEYVGEDGAKHEPFVLHRALLGSLERFMGILIEHYGGAFPTWLAPVQAIIIPIASRHEEYGMKIKDQMAELGIRCELDDRNERMGSKIRDAQVEKIPYMLVVGDREADTASVSVRHRSGEDLGSMPVNTIIGKIADEAKLKS
ncbi:MAG: threonine--tRNA ligase [Dehalococcoidia bacterium]|tara:strand:+ start:1124 stop:2866 length:1743 start_codon:yes stop_codon:yes gene_type:complete